MNELSTPEIDSRHNLNQPLDWGCQDLFYSIFEHAPSAMCVSGLDKRFLQVNSALCQMLGYSAQELVGTSWTELTHPDDLAPSLQLLEQAILEARNFPEVEKRFLHRSGNVVWVRLRVSLIRGSAGQPLYFATHMEDITERKRFMEALCDGEERFRIMADSCPSMMWVTDSEGTMQFVNKVCREFCGIDHDESDCAKCDMLTRPKDSPEYTAVFDRAVKERIPFSAEARVQRGDGTWRLLGSKAEPSISASGEYLGHIGLSADITERTEQEQAREFELSLIRSIHEETLEGILVVDEAGQIVSLNRRFLEIWKITLPNGADPHVNNITAALNRPFLLEALERVESPASFMQRIQELDEHPNEEDHCEIRLKDGRTLERHSTGLKNQQGKYLGRVWFFRDITAHKQAEVSLQNARNLADDANRRLLEKRSVLENERRMLRALIDNIPDFMYVKDTESRFVVANAHLAHVHGVDNPEQLLGKTDFDFYPRELAELFYRDEQSMIRSGEALYEHEEAGLDYKGSVHRTLTTKVPIRDAAGQIIGLAGIGRDITARKQMEDALREAERKYRGMVDDAVVGIFQSTRGGRFISVNPAMALIFGYGSTGEMIETITDIATQIHVNPKRRREFERIVAELGGAHNFEFEALRKDGSRIWVSLNVRAVFEKGVPALYEGMCEDVTERNRLREQLLQAQKLESVGQLAAGIAHEINTPTQYIGDNVRFLKDAFQGLTNLLADYERLMSSAQGGTCSPDMVQQVAATVERIDAVYLLDEIPKAIEQTLEGVNRVSTLVNAMKEFSHPETKEKIPLDLNHAIGNTITVARNEWKYVADLETDFDESLPPIPCHPGAFNQIILNLIVNAAHAIAAVDRKGGQQKGKIGVQTRNCNKWAEIRIQDTGTGIPEKIRNRVFDPFFTTKEIGKGTGQGLAIVHSAVVVKHGGTIHFETEEGKGTIFVIRLPLDGATLAGEVVVP
jgi:PAS domain S-box-containing protein